MRRFPWISVALLLVLGMLAGLLPAEADASTMNTVYTWVGLVCSGLALVIGALGVWARAPATLPTALGIVGAGAFVGSWLAQGMKEDDPMVNLGMVVAFTGVLVAFAASARRVAAPASNE